MRIIIDGRMYGLEHAGIGRYVLNLVHYLEKIDKKNDYFVLLKDKYFRKLEFTNPRFKKVRANYSHYSLVEQIALPFKLFSLRPDLVHFPHFNLPFLYWGKFVVTIHDLIKHEFKGKSTTTRIQFLYWPKYFFYRLLVALVLKKAKVILTPSHWWMERLTEKYRAKREKIIVTYEGANEFKGFSFDKKKAMVLLRELKIKPPYLIYVGNLYPHKNVERLVEAVDKLNTKFNLQLVIVGSRNIFFDRFKKKMAKYGDFVRLVGFQENEELFYLYRQAEALVFPSLLEGFGLPGLEAMAAGIPVIAADNSCLPEIYGQAAIYFDPLKVEDITQKIKELLENKKEEKELIGAGKEQLEKYNWTTTARKTLLSYEKAVSRE